MFHIRLRHNAGGQFHAVFLVCLDFDCHPSHEIRCCVCHWWCRVGALQDADWGASGFTVLYSGCSTCGMLWLESLGISRPHVEHFHC